MVQHNDKWKKKATREYHKKHGTLQVGRGRGRGRGASVEDELPQEVSEENVEQNQDDERDDSSVESGNESGKEEKESRRERSKYSRRKIQSNSWRFESEEPDPYLGNHSSKSMINSSHRRICSRTTRARLCTPPRTTI